MAAGIPLPRALNQFFYILFFFYLFYRLVVGWYSRNNWKTFTTPPFIFFSVAVTQGHRDQKAACCCAIHEKWWSIHQERPFQISAVSVPPYFPFVFFFLFFDGKKRARSDSPPVQLHGVTKKKGPGALLKIKNVYFIWKFFTQELPEWGVHRLVDCTRKCQIVDDFFVFDFPCG